MKAFIFIFLQSLACNLFASPLCSYLFQDITSFSGENKARSIFNARKPPRTDFAHEALVAGQSQTRPVRLLADAETNHKIIFQEFMAPDHSVPITAYTALSYSQLIFNGHFGAGFISFRLVNKQLPLERYVLEHKSVHNFLIEASKNIEGLRLPKIDFEQGVEGLQHNLIPIEYIPGAQASRLHEYTQSSEKKRRLSMEEYNLALQSLKQVESQLAEVLSSLAFKNLVEKNKYFKFNYTRDNFVYFNGEWYLVF